MFDWFVFFASALLVLGQVRLASQDRFFTVAQMRSRGEAQGLPLLYHGGVMWSDPLPFGLLLAYMVGSYWGQWSLLQGVVTTAIGLALSALMHFLVYASLPYAEAHAHDKKLTPAGWLHLFYMGWAFAIIGRFYFCSHGHTVREVVIVSTLLVVHVTIGTHVPLKLWKQRFGLDWFPYTKVWEPGTAGVIAVVAAILAVFSWYTLNYA